MNPTEKHLTLLVGSKVVGLVRSIASDDTCYGLRFSNGLIAWIMCDPEGNGPGFLDIEKDSK